MNVQSVAPSTSPTGSLALDRVLGGGIPVAATLVVAGLPGAGKTVLAEQFLFANATEDAPALYLTTLSEPLEKVVRYLQGFTFFDPARLPGAIHYQDLGQIVRTEGLSALPRLVEDLLIEHRSSFLVIDSFKALHQLSTDPLTARTTIFDVQRVLTASGVTALLLGEYSPADIERLPEFAIADGVMELSNRAHGMREERTIRVHKLRGAAFLPGEHSFRIGVEGLRVFPRLVGADARNKRVHAKRVPTGVPGLDELLAGGLRRGTATLVSGPSGVGKSLLGLRYLAAGAQAGERGVLVSFQESPAQVETTLRGFGLDTQQLETERLLSVLYISPLELDLVELFGQITELLQRTGARRLVLDALNDMQEAAIARERFRAAVWSLVQELARFAVTGLLTIETPLGGSTTTGAAAADLSYLADNILLLRYVRPPRDGYDRELEVLKTRGGGHVPHAQPFRLDAAGPAIGKAASAE